MVIHNRAAGGMVSAPPPDPKRSETEEPPKA